jgi:hypothetical protein
LDFNNPKEISDVNVGVADFFSVDGKVNASDDESSKAPHFSVGMFTNFDIKKFFFEYKWILIFFIPFLIIQCLHILQMHWDTIIYVLNGKWLFGEHIYFELIRPPLPSFLYGLLNFSNLSLLLGTIIACFVFLSGVLLIYTSHKKILD